MKPGHTTPESSSPRFCRGTRGVKQWHYCSVRLHNAAQTHQLFQSQLGLRHGTAWHRVDMSVHHIFSCDCNIPAGTFHWISGITHFGDQFKTQPEKRSFDLMDWDHLQLWRIWSVFYLAYYHLHYKKKPWTPPKPLGKDIQMEAKDGQKSSQSLDTTPKQWSRQDVKSQKRNDSLRLLW